MTKKFNELQPSQDKIKSKINNLHYPDKDYFITASYLLDLANRAHELFISSEMKQKRQLIKMVFQNLRLEGRTIRYDYAKPFDQVFFYVDCKSWLTTIEEVITAKRPIYSLQELDRPIKLVLYLFLATKLNRLVNSLST
ncbi:MAG: hypothetical protein UZ22_OP11002000926 [Microgenomates bacterium OLB23]|nr:MAG: hypothetical protein UZ22_OP11002000926 [Microgenomates bacterium OLB23]